ncbi:MAG: hypothetical protein LBT67_02120, partial [Holosporaceae bacterium]|nr:hypothetical protein [Holosporaceae bacterium]
GYSDTTFDKRYFVNSRGKPCIHEEVLKAHTTDPASYEHPFRNLGLKEHTICLPENVDQIRKMVKGTYNFELIMNNDELLPDSNRYDYL